MFILKPPSNAYADDGFLIKTDNHKIVLDLPASAISCSEENFKIVHRAFCEGEIKTDEQMPILPATSISYGFDSYAATFVLFGHGDRQLTFNWLNQMIGGLG